MRRYLCAPLLASLCALWLSALPGGRTEAGAPPEGSCGAQASAWASPAAALHVAQFMLIYPAPGVAYGDVVSLDSVPSSDEWAALRCAAAEAAAQLASAAGASEAPRAAGLVGARRTRGGETELTLYAAYEAPLEAQGEGEGGEEGGGALRYAPLACPPAADSTNTADVCRVVAYLEALRVQRAPLLPVLAPALGRSARAVVAAGAEAATAAAVTVSSVSARELGVAPGPPALRPTMPARLLEADGVGNEWLTAVWMGFFGVLAAATVVWLARFEAARERKSEKNKTDAKREKVKREKAKREKAKREKAKSSTKSAKELRDEALKAGVVVRPVEAGSLDGQSPVGDGGRLLEMDGGHASRASSVDFLPGLTPADVDQLQLTETERRVTAFGETDIRRGHTMVTETANPLWGAANGL